VKQNAKVADMVMVKLESVIEKEEVTYVKDKGTTGKEMANVTSESENSSQFMTYQKGSSSICSSSRSGMKFVN